MIKFTIDALDKRIECENTGNPTGIFYIIYKIEFLGGIKMVNNSNSFICFWVLDIYFRIFSMACCFGYDKAKHIYFCRYFC